MSLQNFCHSHAFQGHDDAIAILMALHCPEVELLGVSTVPTHLLWTSDDASTFCNFYRFMEILPQTIHFKTLVDCFMLSGLQKTYWPIMVLQSH
jgi:hypothetical protein